MIEHHPPKVLHGLRKYLHFENRGKDTIRIVHLMFQSDIHPRQWDTTGDTLDLGRNKDYKLPIVGTGRIFLRWKTPYGLSADEKADSFQVVFDKAGQPFPYIFGGDQWTMALRHAAMIEVDKHGIGD